MEAFCEWRLRGAGASARLAYHDPRTVSVLANFGLTTQLALLGLCLAAGQPALFLWLAVGSTAAPVLLALRRELLLRRTLARAEPATV